MAPYGTWAQGDTVAHVKQWNCALSFKFNRYWTVDMGLPFCFCPISSMKKLCDKHPSSKLARIEHRNWLHYPKFWPNQLHVASSTKPLPFIQVNHSSLPAVQVSHDQRTSPGNRFGASHRRRPRQHEGLRAKDFAKSGIKWSSTRRTQRCP